MAASIDRFVSWRVDGTSRCRRILRRLAIGVAVAALVLGAPATAHAAPTVVFSDDFESGSLASWEVGHLTGATTENLMRPWADCDWGHDATWTNWGKGLVAYCARQNNEYPGYDPDAFFNYVPHPLENWMIAGPFDLSGANSATLAWEAWCWLNPGDYYVDDHYEVADEFRVGYSTDGVNFETTEYGAGMTTNGWGSFSQDLSPVAGNSRVWIGYFFHADWGSIKTQGAYVNNVALTKDYVVTPPVAAPVVAKPKVALGAPVAPKTMKKSKSYTVYGSLKPKHAKGTKVVRIYKYKKVGKKWVKKGFVTAKAYNYKGYTRYKVKMKLTSKGTWRLKAYAPDDSKHAATWSGHDNVAVR